MSKQVELDMELLVETDAAVRVRVDDKNVWLPKSQIDMEEGAEVGDVVAFLLPEWLAIEKELI
jgi:hypothetical protein